MTLEEASNKLAQIFELAMVSGIVPKKYSITPPQLRGKMAKKEAQRKRNAGRLARKAAAVLEDRKWVKHALSTGSNDFCAVGALNFALCGNAQPKVTQKPVAEVELLFEQWHGNRLMNFNDHVADSKEAVIEQLTKFANEFDPKGDL